MCFGGIFENGALGNKHSSLFIEMQNDKKERLGISMLYLHTRKPWNLRYLLIKQSPSTWVGAFIYHSTSNASHLCTDCVIGTNGAWSYPKVQVGHHWWPQQYNSWQTHQMLYLLTLGFEVTKLSNISLKIRNLIWQ